MKALICGKGGCGKSTLAVLLARALARRGNRVLLVDADESNSGLHRALGVAPPDSLLSHLGGKAGLRRRRADPLAGNTPFPGPMTFDTLPESCLASAGGVRLMAVGKVESFGEGCACPIGRLFRDFFAKLDLRPRDVVLVDAEAGVEHFGRRLDAHCDLVLTVVDPTRESLDLAPRVSALAAEAGAAHALVLNRIDEQTRPLMEESLGAQKVLAALPDRRDLFLANLAGDPLTADPPELEALCEHLERGPRRPAPPDPFVLPGGGG